MEMRNKGRCVKVEGYAGVRRYAHKRNVRLLQGRALAGRTAGLWFLEGGGRIADVSISADAVVVRPVSGMYG